LAATPSPSANQTEQYVLGADERVVEVTCFFLREHKYSAGTGQ